MIASHTQSNRQRTLLEEALAAQHQRVAGLRADLAELVSDQGLTELDTDEGFGEGATTAIDKDRDEALYARGRQAIVEIEEALARLDSGTYGRCQSCGGAIPRERLEALPTATTCVRCKVGGRLSQRSRPGLAA